MERRVSRIGANDALGRPVHAKSCPILRSGPLTILAGFSRTLSATPSMTTFMLVHWFKAQFGPLHHDVVVHPPLPGLSSDLALPSPSIDSFSQS